MPVGRVALLLRLLPIVAIEGCIVSRSVEPPTAEPPPPVIPGVAKDVRFSTHANVGADLVRGLEDELISAGATTAQELHSTQGVSVAIKVSPSPVFVESLWHRAASFTLFLLPSWENDAGYGVSFEVAHGDRPMGRYGYHMRMERFAWLPALLVLWLNVWGDSEEQAGRTIAQRFLDDAQRDGVLSSPGKCRADDTHLTVEEGVAGVRFMPSSTIVPYPDFYTLAGRRDLAESYRASGERWRTVGFSSAIAAGGAAVGAGVMLYLYAVTATAQALRPRCYLSCNPEWMLGVGIGAASAALLSGILAAVGFSADPNPLSQEERADLYRTYNQRARTRCESPPSKPAREDDIFDAVDAPPEPSAAR